MICPCLQPLCRPDRTVRSAQRGSDPHTGDDFSLRTKLFRGFHHVFHNTFLGQSPLNKVLGFRVRFALSFSRNRAAVLLCDFFKEHGLPTILQIQMLQRFRNATHLEEFHWTALAYKGGDTRLKNPGLVERDLFQSISQYSRVVQPATRSGFSVRATIWLGQLSLALFQ